MSPRLTVCFGLSVLLHGVLLWSMATVYRSGSKGHLPRTNVEARMLEVYLEPKSSKALSWGEVARTARQAKSKVASPTPIKPEVITPRTVAAPAWPASDPGWRVQPPPDFRDTQMNYQQNFEMQAKQQAIQQAQMFAASLQADIEQSISLRSGPVAGRCDWLEETSTFQCASMALQHWMQPDVDRLRALHEARRMLGNPLEGFTIVIGINGASIAFH